MASLDHLVKQWLDLDQDESTRREILDLAAATDNDELERRLGTRITFGTAGLRSSMKAGFAHMNCVTVIQASQGLADYILAGRCASMATVGKPSVVVGYDARYRSEKFARLAGAAFLASGFTVLWFRRLVHTPMVPFAVSHHGAAAGVMVTASHNPKSDNGYKVYWSNGCQIIPPHDSGIAKAIESQRSIASWDATLVDHSPDVKFIDQEVSIAYFESIRKLIPGPVGSGVEFMYTPMHGVGLPFMQEALKLLQLEGHMRVVAKQALPDPEFSTVPFPNPEEKGALDLAKAEGLREGCNLILANDPDADRFAAAELLTDGTWHQFTGNEMGILLASYVLDTYIGSRDKIALLASTVSSRMLATVASVEGFRFQETLTGFKWLGNIAQDLTKEGCNVLFAYEEAIGYMFPSVVWDKDGIAAATVFLLACMKWKTAGLTPWQRLQQLYEKYGYFENANTYLVSTSPAVTNAVFTDIRESNDGSRPLNVGDREILRWRDLTLGYDTANADGKPDLPVDASAQMLTCELQDVVFTARGSGTEPKIKLYIEARGSTTAEAKTRANAALDDLLKEWFKPEYGLKLAGT